MISSASRRVRRTRFALSCLAFLSICSFFSRISSFSACVFSSSFATRCCLSRMSAFLCSYMSFSLSSWFTTFSNCA